jgi:hypothetical protein
MGANCLRSTFLLEDPSLDANEDEVAEFIETMLNELSLLAAKRVTSPHARERVDEKIELFEAYFVRKTPRMLC